MAADFRDLSNESITNANRINNRLIEKTLAMRCNSYLSHIKAKLLTDTIYEIDSSKKALFNINSRLEQEIQSRKEMEEKLRSSTKEAEGATRLKDKFVALVTHDLKNPLNVISGSLQLLHLSSQLSESEKDMVESALFACGQMNNLISDVLNLSRIKQGKIMPELRLFDLTALIGKLIKLRESQADKKGVKLVSAIPDKSIVFADELLLAEVFENLLSNAVKFCAEGDTVKIYLPHDKPATIAVADTGAGVPQEFLENLFSYEEKTSSIGTEGEMGTGFGLPLSHEIVIAHGGKMWVESFDKKGSTFFVTLPSLSSDN
ncbi:Phosphate regulon sensor protein PhoR [gamma proteobacterium IMCC2047]|nr:Phosphate regulon sensor protein PhoR [gamma proteobacterium IMCC2047]